MKSVSPEIAARLEIRRDLIVAFTKSITGAKSPEVAAEYVVNLLTVHRLDLLATAAALFAEDETVRRVLALPHRIRQ